MTGEGRRAKRVSELLRMHLTQLMNRELDDPTLTTLVVTTVDVPDDSVHRAHWCAPLGRG